MAIFYYEFKIPFNTNNPSQISFEDSTLFAKKQEIPSGFRKDITPPGYRDQYVLKTKTDPNEKEHEDTIGLIEVTLRGKKVSAFSVDPELGSGNLIETETPKSFFEVDGKNPIFILSRPNVLDGGGGIRVDGIVRYLKSK